MLWILYRLVVFWWTLVVRIFFRDMRVVGTENIPREGAVIFAANHPNMSLDPILIATTSGRLPCCFWAKSGLFRGRLAGAVLRAVGAVPVHRRRDGHTGGAHGNDGLFAATVARLREGHAMGVFVEGTSSHSSGLLALKDGAAWAALLTARAGTPVVIVPVGLNFFRKAHFRGSVVVEYGAPLLLSEYVAEFRACGDDVGAQKRVVKRVTGELTERMHGVTMSAPNWEALKTTFEARRLYTSGDVTLEEHVALTKLFVRSYRTLDDGSEEKGKMRQLMHDVHEFVQEMEDCHIKDSHLRERLTKGVVFRLLLQHVMFLVLLSPVLVLASLLHSPLFVLGAYVSHVTRNIEERAHLKFAIMATLLPMYWVVITLWLSSTYGGTWAHAVVVLGTLVVVGVANVRVLDEERAIFKSTASLSWILIFLIGASKKMEHMFERREELRRRVREAVCSHVVVGSLGTPIPAVDGPPTPTPLASRISFRDLRRRAFRDEYESIEY